MSNPYAPPSSEVAYKSKRPVSFFWSGFFYACAGWATDLFARMVPFLLGLSCDYPVLSSGKVFLVLFLAPTTIGLSFMLWAERRNYPAKRLGGFFVGLITIPLFLFVLIVIVHRAYRHMYGA